MKGNIFIICNVILMISSVFSSCYGPKTSYTKMKFGNGRYIANITTPDSSSEYYIVVSFIGSHKPDINSEIIVNWMREGESAVESDQLPLKWFQCTWGPSTSGPRNDIACRIPPSITGKAFIIECYCDTELQKQIESMNILETSNHK